MKVVTKIDEIPKLEGPIALTIGVYDGVHLGHQFILSKLSKLTRKKGSRVLLTFSNHPSTFLTPNSPTAGINSFEHRLTLLEKENLDLVIALPFDQTVANQSYEDFFSHLRAYLPFSYLVVGEDARFGKGRLGGPDEIKAMNWESTYLGKQTYHKHIISSGAIRNALQQKDLKLAKKMLGRPYSILLPFESQDVIVENEVQYKWVTGAKGLSLMPPGVYAVDLYTNEKSPTPAIAFYNGSQNINGQTELDLTIYFEKPIQNTHQVEIAFISFLHDELDPEFQTSSKANLLETLKFEFFPS